MNKKNMWAQGASWEDINHLRLVDLGSPRALYTSSISIFPLYTKSPSPLTAAERKRILILVDYAILTEYPP